jgi:hypothetical protein
MGFYTVHSGGEELHETAADDDMNIAVYHFIDQLVGHETEAIRQRYRHLHPSTQQEAITRFFE